MYSLLASAVNHPDQVNRLWGLFNHRSLHALAGLGVDVETVVPRPYAPPVGPYSGYRSIPARDDSFSYPVSHPRFVYYLPKSLLYHRTGDSMASTLESWYEDASLSSAILHGCHVYPDGFALSRLSRAADIPLTVYAHGTIINQYQEFNTQTQRRIDTTLREAAQVFCSGEDIRTKIGAIEPATEPMVVPIGATPSNFPTQRGSQLRHELKIPPGATVILYCGHLTEEKGVQDVLEVLPDIDDDQLYVVFIGHGGALKPEVQSALSDEQTPPGELLWKLHPVAVRRWFATADLLVLPSYSEGRPTVIYEAMASRTPVLASNVGGIPEQVEDGETGWLIEPGATDSLRRMLQDLPAERLQEMGGAAERRLTERGWTWQSHAKSIIEVHNTLLGQSSQTDSGDMTLSD